MVYRSALRVTEPLSVDGFFDGSGSDDAMTDVLMEVFQTLGVLYIQCTLALEKYTP